MIQNHRSLFAVPWSIFPLRAEKYVTISVGRYREQSSLKKENLLRTIDDNDSGNWSRVILSTLWIFPQKNTHAQCEECRAKIDKSIPVTNA